MPDNSITISQKSVMSMGQDDLLAVIAEAKYYVSIYLISGIRLQGYLIGSDKHTIFLKSHLDEKIKPSPLQVIYKHTISTISITDNPAQKKFEY